jgi:hypothetical protein
MAKTTKFSGDTELAFFPGDYKQSSSPAGIIFTVIANQPTSVTAKPPAQPHPTAQCFTLKKSIRSADTIAISSSDGSITITVN